MSLSIAGKVAIVTGGSKGIGRAAAIRLAQNGAKVIINYAGDDKAAEETVKTIGANAHAIKADCGNITEITRLVDETVAHFGGIDIVVANAGVMTMGTLENLTEQDYDTMFNTNVKGPLFLTQKAAPYLKSGSRVIFFSTSLTGVSPISPDYLPYVASKGAVEQMVRCLSKDLARKGITVNAVAPGPTATELFLKGKPEQVIKMIASQIPQGRLGQPEDIASLVAFLASEESQWVTGQTLRTNGGMA